MSDSRELLVMLEDDRDRLERFTRILSEHLPKIEFLYWRTSYDFFRGYQCLERGPKLITLDHDLFVDDPGDPDPGDGRDVAKYLASQSPTCPVLIHSSNAPAADSMLYTLRDAGWKADRIAPIGEYWIEEDWFPMIRELLGHRR